MKVGIIADTHDYLPNIDKAVSLFNERKVEHIIHAGDIVSPFTANIFRKLRAPMKAVFGNNDGDKLFLAKSFEGIAEFHERYLTLELQGKRILVFHQPDFIESVSRSRDYDVVIHGHTHKMRVDNREALLINPGECCGYLTNRASVVILDLNTMNVEVLELPA
ncbi:MAG: metallophosphoesterase [Candidatus Coatesbacteria bacterium]|nr:metallophosphoesterase [Candidatus Coatesbacteria bacterium]